MKKILLLAILLLLSKLTSAQIDSSIVANLLIDETIFTMPERPATFVGGWGSLYNFFSQNIQYPLIARENEMSAKVILRVVIEKNGSISNTKVLQVNSNKEKIIKRTKADFKKKKKEFTEKEIKYIELMEESLIDEAKRVVSIMPLWESGNEKGVSVRSYCVIPIIFK
jgi:hypothetical protein